MPTWLEIALGILLVLVILLAVGGVAANRRRLRQLEPELEQSLEEINRALAAAHAQDKGWEPEGLHAAARRLFEAERPGESVRDATLVQVVDRPGTDEDHAVFRITTDSGRAYLTLGRRDGEWVAERLS